jgi:flagellar basal-body rod protein FlgF
MVKEIYTAALGMMPQMTRLEVIANNMANSATTGFKREDVFQRALIDAKQNMHHQKGSVSTDDVINNRQGDFSMGATESTGNAMDVAIDGKGFFLVRDSTGGEFLTRAGNFTVNEDGYLTTPDGKQVMADNGPLLIRTAFEQSRPVTKEDEQRVGVRIEKNGEVFVNEFFLGQLTIMDVENPQSLKRASGTLFATTDATDMRRLNDDQVSVKQGFIEKSNVNIVSEMINMIMIQKNFEMGQKVISTNDDTVGKSIDLARING